MDKCRKCNCICLECKEKFKIYPNKCEHSNCPWCKNGEYCINTCGVYIERGGTYGKGE